MIEKKDRKKTGGALHFLKAECKREFTWLDFVKGGYVSELIQIFHSQIRMQLEFAVAIDFTASNGDVNQPTSRHYIDQFCLNQAHIINACNRVKLFQYELAIRSVLEICEVFSRIKLFGKFIIPF